MSDIDNTYRMFINKTLDEQELDFDIEHIFPKKRIATLKKRYLKLPISSLGNLTLLSSKTNRTKQDLTLYDLKLPEFLINDKIKNWFIYPSQTKLNSILDTIDTENKAKILNDYFNERNAQLVEELLKLQSQKYYEN